MSTLIEAAPAKRRRPPGALRQFVARLVREQPVGAAAGLVFIAFLFCGVFAHLLAPYGFNEISPLQRLKPPSLRHLFGTDNLGRDVLSRCLYGAQLSVIIGLSAAALATVLSVTIGTVTAYIGGRFDMIAQRFVDAYMSFPELVILITVVSVLGPGMIQIIGILSLVLGIAGSRIIRSAVLSVREQSYVHAAQSIGGTSTRVMLRHVLPNVMAPVIVLFTVGVGNVILAESALSFLGFGVPPPAPTWGGMLTGSSRNYMYLAPWMALAPGVCLTLVVFSINMFGDALRDLLDPRMRNR